jgi:hypothetical protein
MTMGSGPESSGFSEAESHTGTFAGAVWKVVTKRPGEGSGGCAQWLASVLGFLFMATCLLLTLGLRSLIQARLCFKPPQWEGSASARRREWW